MQKVALLIALLLASLASAPALMAADPGFGEGEMVWLRDNNGGVTAVTVATQFATGEVSVKIVNNEGGGVEYYRYVTVKASQLGKLEGTKEVPYKSKVFVPVKNGANETGYLEAKVLGYFSDGSYVVGNPKDTFTMPQSVQAEALILPAAEYNDKVVKGINTQAVDGVVVGIDREGKLLVRLNPGDSFNGKDVLVDRQDVTVAPAGWTCRLARLFGRY
ncbi:hypothetical protein E3A20_14200 [Planctomyces bekefii]|uniref:SLA1 homology domain-containing protein n=1 Tax=Planctomyces bekefii TaxID=1653850 RepID=A0A5C6M8X9_9PLAN|nr:hypothetical protein E3A20_14200 [Planctomyces bekefii]